MMWGRWLVAALLVAALLWMGNKVRGWHDEAVTYKRQVQDLTQAKARTDGDLVTAARINRELSADNDRHLADLKGARDETARLRDCLRAGTCGLRIVSHAPVRPPGVASAPGAATSTPVGDGAGAGLDGDAERAYLALRDGIEQQTAQLAACQDQLKARLQP